MTRTVPLSQLLRVLPDAELHGDADVLVSDLAHDSHQAGPGTLFIAVPSIGGDARSGGARFLSEVAAQGATAAVVQRGAPVPENLPCAVVPDTRVALADLAVEFFEHPADSLQLYGVTGTDGKTTTSHLTEQVFAGHGYRTGLIGTVEFKIGEQRFPNSERLTTPESLEIQRMLRGMVEAGVTHVVVEASSHGLALERLRGCRTQAAAVTNITSDHLDFHGPWEEYFLAKARLFTDLNKDRPAMLNADDSSFDRLAGLVGDCAVPYGLHAGVRIRAIDVRQEPRSTTFRVTAGNEPANVRLSIPGLFNVSNALAVCGLAGAAGIPLPEIAGSLSAAAPPPGRMQRIDRGQPFQVIVDYAHTPHGIDCALAALRPAVAPGGRLIAVFGAAGERDRTKRPKLAQVARKWADYLVVTSEDPRSEDPWAIIDEIIQGIPDDREGVHYEREEDRARAIERAVAAAGPNDTVVILGKGHEATIVYDGWKRPWSDVQAALDALEKAH